MTKPKPESAKDEARHRRAERILGGLLPDQTQDESADAWGDKDRPEERDDELRRDVPPHHGA